MERKDPLRKHAAPTPSRGYIASCAVKCDAHQIRSATCPAELRRGEMMWHKNPSADFEIHVRTLLAPGAFAHAGFQSRVLGRNIYSVMSMSLLLIIILTS